MNAFRIERLWQHRPALSRYLGDLVFLCVALSYAYYYAILRVTKPEWEPVSFLQMVQCSALKPYQYRALFSLLVRGLVSLPLAAPAIASPRGYCLVIELVSTFLLVVGFRIYMRRTTGDAFLAAFGSVVLMLVLPFNYIMPRIMRWYFVYDTPAVLFFLVGLLLLSRRAWVLYYPAFAIATLNRETSCFLALVYLATTTRRDRPLEVVGHCAAQFCLWMGIKAALAWTYAANDGMPFNVLLSQNLRSLTSVYALGHLLSTFGYTWIPAVAWVRSVPVEFVRRAFYVVPAYFLAMLVVGKVDEIRIYGELIPIVLPVFVIGLASRLRRLPLEAGSAWATAERKEAPSVAP